MRSDMTMWKVLAMTCKKKRISPESVLNMRVAYDDMDEEAIMDKPLSFYTKNLARIILLPVEEINELESELPDLPKKDFTKTANTGRRRGSAILDAHVLHQQFHATSEEFPATVNDSDLFRKKVSGIFSKGRKGTKTISKIFKKSNGYHAPEEGNISGMSIVEDDSRSRRSSASSTHSKRSSRGISSFFNDQEEAPEMPSVPAEFKSLSRRSRPISEALVSGVNYISLHGDDDNIADIELQNENEAKRKRQSWNPHGDKHDKRTSAILSRPRTQSSNNSHPEHQDTEVPLPGNGERLVFVLITFPNTDIRPSDTAFPGDTIMEVVLKTTCQKNNLDFSLYTTILHGKSGVKILMDKPLSMYADERYVNLDIVKGDKIYETVCVKEAGSDVMIIRNVMASESEEVIVMAATIDKIIERLTDDQINDHPFLEISMMCFRSFMTPSDMLDRLIGRFDAELPESPTEEDTEFFQKHKVPIQRKVLYVLGWWISRHWHDFGLDENLKNELETFIADFLVDDKNFLYEAHDLVSLIGEQSAKFDEDQSASTVNDRRRKTLQSIVHDIEPEELAQELCLFDFKAFSEIHPIDFLKKICGGSKSATPGLDKFIWRFDQISYWVCTEIVMIKDHKRRSSVLKMFIQAARYCQQYNNFFSMFAILSGLSLSPVEKLKRTWESLSSATRKTYSELERLTDPMKNMKNFRDILSSATPPMIPFLPIYLKDLTFMNDGNASKVAGMINFDKLRMMANCVKEIVSLGETPYKFESNPIIANYITVPPTMDKNLSILNEWSKECEPR
ncbi:MAG: hypothetical protein SGCHY_001603 [Lobulomycetales sp.]